MKKSLGLLLSASALTDEQERQKAIVLACHEAGHHPEVRLGGPGWPLRGCTVCWPCKQKIKADDPPRSEYIWPSMYSRW